ncbi:cysteine--tRNA ligase [Candidatus Peregrinibacteria bacterium CG10_big_fil_rev_8_21_14_0_10_49_10]|nr:MAG: cysteine--tRNA ligase [Candidatus Peregrinibacteria bacterium CG10_big_fil_rev_8_21_14_0_10_49_10]
MLRFYNTFTKKEEEFVPAEKGKVRMYTCGPTVYGRPHIGNYSSFLMADLIQRWLEVSGYEVTLVKNITDVGHLVADADSGEDKVEKEARRIAAEQGRKEITHEDVIAVARQYEAQYIADEHLLNLREPAHRPRASETIEGMIAIIQKLVEAGHAYETDDGLYFSVESFADYGKLSGNTLDKLDAGARVEVKEHKKHPADFALWKKCVGSNSHHVLRWPSPWGEGFPGWHIECSAMSQAFLGPQIDIHTGGEDNIFPHHECEIAQSECSGPAPFVRLWIHKRRIDMGSQKMSKSLGNVLSLSDIQEMGYSPLDLRYYFLSVHYRTQLKFTEKGLEDAKKARRKIMEWMSAIDSTVPVSSSSGHAISESIQHFNDAMNADLNTPAALAEVFAAMNLYYQNMQLDTDCLTSYLEFIKIIRQTFGCFYPEEVQDIPAEIQVLLEQRETARKDKNFEEADRLREELEQQGFEVRDTDKGQKLTRM